MVPTPRTAFIHNDDEEDPEPEGGDTSCSSSSSSAFSCGTSEGSRIWCNRTDTMGIIMATMAL